MCNAPTEKFIVLGKRLNSQQGFRPHKKTGIAVSVCKCMNCGLIFANPQPIPQSIEDHYGIPAENYWKEEYFKEDTSYFQGEIKWLKKLKKIEPGMRSLDIGSGIGKQMLALQKVGFDAYGIEPSIPFYEKALENMSISGDKLSNVSIEDANFSNEYFDFISFGAVLEHLYHPSECLQKVIPWLKKDGIIHIEVPNANWLISKIVNRAYRLTGKDYCTNLSPMHNPFHLYEFTLQSFLHNSSQNNFKIADYAYYVCRTYMPKVFDFILKPYMRRTNTGMQLCLWLKRD